MAPETKPHGPSDRGERIGHTLARAGVASRRAAETLIAERRVALNGVIVMHPATFVHPGDHIEVDGRPIPEAAPTRLFRYHKPPGLVSTSRDPEGRPTIFQHLPPRLGRLISVGRLDIASEGLLLLTNDGGLARYLELPQTGWVRRYRVRVHGEVDEARLRELAAGIEVGGIRYAPIEAGLDAKTSTNAWLSLSLREGRNREIRRVLEALGLAVNRLIRVSFGPFQLGTLPRDALAEVPAKVLREQLPKGRP